MSNESAFLSTGAAAKLIGYSRTAIFSAMGRGTLPVVCYFEDAFGRLQPIFKREDILTYRDERQHMGRPGPKPKAEPPPT